jgi:lysophospholipase L1-like esterase
MSPRLRVAGVSVATLAASLIGMPSAHAATSSVAPAYVALGDSYASGVGTRTYYSDSGSCYRSPYAYAVLDAVRLGASLSFQACSGARTGDVKNNQLGTLSASTTYVTVQVGGNDAGFSDVLTECAQPGWASDCNGAIDSAQSKITNTLPAALDSLYSAIRSKAPDAKVVVVGYPRIFNGEDCNAGTWFSPSEETRLNQTADLLNSKLSSRAAAKGFSFVNPTSAFIGHAVCDSTEWINGLSNPIRESYHPNRSGATGFANLVDDYLT